MKTNTAKTSSVRDIITSAAMPVSVTTLKWFEAMYVSGAVIYEPNGDVTLNPKIREAVAAMHHILAGGDVEVTVRRSGDKNFERLEAMFEQSLIETSTANKHRTNSDQPTLYLP